MRHMHSEGCGRREGRSFWQAMKEGGFGGGPRGRSEGRRGHGGHGGHGGERRRMFEAGELRLVLLNLIEEQPRHGYDLIREIESRSGGAYAPSPGVVYPTMTLLIDMGLAEEQISEGPRKLLTITQAGRDHLTERADEVAVAMARLAALAQASERTDAAPVRRAMQNLKAALQDRLSQDGVTRDVQLDVARIIDEAASKIERL